MLSVLPYGEWKKRPDEIDSFPRVRNDVEALAYANENYSEVSEPIVVVESHHRLAPRIRFLQQSLDKEFREVLSRPALAERLDLVPHVEGGWAQSIWTSSASARPDGFPGTRPTSTALHYVLGAGDRSRWHRLAADELWLWQRGGTLRFLTAGNAERPAADPDARLLGPDLDAGQALHILVRGGTWMAAEPAYPAETLIACIASPGFDNDDYELL